MFSSDKASGGVHILHHQRGGRRGFRDLMTVNDEEEGCLKPR